jgi:EmrB/QacA subfamily drug resistance transporter
VSTPFSGRSLAHTRHARPPFGPIGGNRATWRWNVSQNPPSPSPAGEALEQPSARPETNPDDAISKSSKSNRRWFTLGVVAISQLTVVIDLTIVNVALPDAQRALGISDGNRQWVVTSYALAFGSLLLLGGRIADYWGRKRSFIVGLIGFAAASALGGVSQSGAQLFGARALQGVFGALLAPAALSVLQIAFPSGRERARAFSVFGAVAGGGAALGSVVGGILTEYANWRWCLLVNVPVVIFSVIAASYFVDESKAQGDTRYDLPGAVSATLGLAALVFGFTKASMDGWGATSTLLFLAAGVVFLVAFVLIEIRSSHPLLPMKIVLHRTRGGSLLTALLAGSALLGVMLFLTYYMQVTLHYTPLKAGLASLPTTAVFVVGTGIIERAMVRFGPQTLMIFGAIVASIGTIVLTQISLTVPYWQCVLPGQLILGTGLVSLFIPLSSAALIDVDDHDAGAASGMLNATQQVGGAVGTALFSTIYASAVAGYLARHANVDSAVALSQVHGYVVAFRWASAAMLLAALSAVTLIRVGRDDVNHEATGLL